MLHNVDVMRREFRYTGSYPNHKARLLVRLSFYASKILLSLRTHSIFLGGHAGLCALTVAQTNNLSTAHVDVICCAVCLIATS